MVPVARRNLLADKVKLLIALGGVTLAIVLILVQQSVYQGVRREGESFIRSMPGDLWVMQRGSTDLVFSSSYLPEMAREEIQSLDGVESVYGLMGGIVSFQANGGGAPTYVMALNVPTEINASELARIIPRRGEIIVDHAFAREKGLSTGDSLRLHNREFTVAGVRHVGNVLVTQFSYMASQDYEELFGVPGTVNYFLVSLRDPSRASQMAQAIRSQIPDADVLSTDEFAKLNLEEGTGAFLPTIRVIVAIAFIVGLSVLSLTMYTITIERAREYAIMKALGASPYQLYRIVISQSFTIAMIGFGLGVGMAFLYNDLVVYVVPEFITYIRWQDVAIVLGVAAVMSFVASYLPINRVARVDPATVFRA